VPILIGGASDKAVERTVKYGIGYTAGGGGPGMMAPIAEKVRRSRSSIRSTAWPKRSCDAQRLGPHDTSRRQNKAADRARKHTAYADMTTMACSAPTNGPKKPPGPLSANASVGTPIAVTSE
jgi:hypothetical protein